MVNTTLIIFLISNTRSPSTGASISTNFLSQPFPEKLHFLERLFSVPRKESRSTDESDLKDGQRRKSARS